VSRDSRYVENQIDEFTYPAKLPTEMKRFLAGKINDLHAEARDKRNDLQGQLNNLQATKVIPFNALKRKQKAKIAQVQKLEAAQKKLEEAASTHRSNLYKVMAELRELGVVSHTPTEATVKASDAEYQKKREALSAALAKVDVDAKQAYADVRTIALELAEAQMEALRNRIAKLSPKVAARIDNIGNLKALTGEVVEAEQ
jgi:hypothetical protein